MGRFADWVMDNMSQQQIYDSYFILSDLVDMNLSQQDWDNISEGDAKSLQNAGITIANGRVYGPGSREGIPTAKWVR